MTSHFMQRYLSDRTFYKIQSQSIIDNPDQRIVDDLSSFTSTALSFSLTLFNAAVDLISFSNILYTIYPPLFVVLLLYSLGGTAISIFLGKVLNLLSYLFYLVLFRPIDHNFALFLCLIFHFRNWLLLISFKKRKKLTSVMGLFVSEKMLNPLLSMVVKIMNCNFCCSASQVLLKI